MNKKIEEKIDEHSELVTSIMVGCMFGMWQSDAYAGVFMFMLMLSVFTFANK